MDCRQFSRRHGFLIDKTRLATNLYTIFEDHFDFLIVFNQYDYETDLDLTARAGYSGINGSVSNSVSGLRRTPTTTSCLSGPTSML